jgi:hypothetical protein
MTPEGTEGKADATTDRVERDKSIKDLYRRLQAVFPSFDPKKEPAFRTGGGQKPGGTANQASPTTQRTPQMPNAPIPNANQAGASS